MTNTTTQEELLPCPCRFCGHVHVRVASYQSRFDFGDDYYAVTCDGCGTIGPGRVSEEEAITAWNQPAEQPAIKVCCQQYATCLEPCTPRGRWLAEQPADDQPCPHCYGITPAEQVAEQHKAFEAGRKYEREQPAQGVPAAGEIMDDLAKYALDFRWSDGELLEALRRTPPAEQPAEGVTDAEKLIECRGSVAFDLRTYEQLILRKGESANQCDHDEANRLQALLDYIDLRIQGEDHPTSQAEGADMSENKIELPHVNPTDHPERCYAWSEVELEFIYDYGHKCAAQATAGLRAELAGMEALAQARLEQMQADRKAYLDTRDELAQVREELHVITLLRDAQKQEWEKAYAIGMQCQAQIDQIREQAERDTVLRDYVRQFLGIPLYRVTNTQALQAVYHAATIAKLKEQDNGSR